MASAEYLVETAAMTLLAANSDLSGVTIKHHQEDDETVSIVNRIIVRCDPKTPMFPSRRGNTVPLFWEAQVVVTGKTNGAETVIETWRDAIDASLNGVTGSLVQFFPATGGDVSTGATDQRTVTRTFRAKFAIA